MNALASSFLYAPLILYTFGLCLISWEGYEEWTNPRKSPDLIVSRIRELCVKIREPVSVQCALRPAHGDKKSVCHLVNFLIWLSDVELLQGLTACFRIPRRQATEPREPLCGTLLPQSETMGWFWTTSGACFEVRRPKNSASTSCSLTPWWEFTYYTSTKAKGHRSPISACSPGHGETSPPRSRQGKPQWRRRIPANEFLQMLEEANDGPECAAVRWAVVLGANEKLAL